jgi:CO/xanthine dehydrogenase FAD-binding subunit
MKGRRSLHLPRSQLDDVDFANGKFTLKGTDKIVPFGNGTHMCHIIIQKISSLVLISSFYDPANFTFPFGCHIAVVEVEKETGKISLKRIIAVDDVGNVINPMIVEGQIHGGVVQGIGQALFEGAEYDENGQLTNASYMDYCMPRAEDFPMFETASQVTPCPHNPLGVKGAGEAGTIGAAPAVVNAVIDALWSGGHRVKDIRMPLTPERVWRAMQNNWRMKIFNFKFYDTSVFDYQKVKNIDEAIAALSNGGSKILAGGHSLLPAMKLRLSQPSKLVDIADIADLKGIKEEDGEIVIGAATTHANIERNNLSQNNYLFLLKALLSLVICRFAIMVLLAVVLPMQILQPTGPHWCWQPMQLSLCKVVVASGVKQPKLYWEFRLHYWMEKLSRPFYTCPSDGTGGTYQNSHPASRFAVVGCAVMRFGDGKTNIAFTGVSDTPFRDINAENSISGKAINDDSIAAAVNVAVQNVTISSDRFASQEYRRHLAKVYLKKALQAVA